MTDRIPAPTNRDWPDRLYKWLLRNWAPSGTSVPGAANWGDIGGTLADQTDLQSALNGKETVGQAASAVSVHASAADPHTVYLLKTAAVSSYAALAHTHAQSDVTGLVAALEGFVSSSVAYAIAQSAVGLHEGLVNPHIQYRLASEAIAVTAISASGTPTGSTYLRGDGQWTSVSASVTVGNTVTSVGGVVQLANDTSTVPPVSFYGSGLDGVRGYKPGHAVVRLGGDSGAQTTSALTNAVGLAFSVVSSTSYLYDFFILFQSAGTTNGIKLGLTYPTATYQSGTVLIPVAADANNATFSGWITSSGDAVVGTGVQANNTTYCARMYGSILPSANGTLQVQFAGELNTTTGVTVKAGSAGMLYRVS